MRAENFPTTKSGTGFTLVEVMVGMALLAMIFTSAFGAYFMGLKMIESARDELRASQIIQSELEAMRTLNWEDLEEMSNSFALIEPQGEFVQQFADRYRAYRQVLDINPLQKRVILLVYWRTDPGKPWQSRLFNTIFTKGGLNDYFYREV